MIKGSHHSAKTKEYMTISNRGKGKPRSEEVRKHLSVVKKGKRTSIKSEFKVGHAVIGGGNYKDGRCLNHGYNRWRRSKLKLNGSHTLEDWETLKAQYNWTCPCCKRHEPDIKLTEDHIIPVSKGGSNNIENIQPLCMPCNARKYTKIIKY